MGKTNRVDPREIDRFSFREPKRGKLRASRRKDRAELRDQLRKLRKRED
jgi:hypothetical protein